MSEDNVVFTDFRHDSNNDKLRERCYEFAKSLVTEGEDIKSAAVCMYLGGVMLSMRFEEDFAHCNTMRIIRDDALGWIPEVEKIMAKRFAKSAAEDTANSE